MSTTLTAPAAVAEAAPAKGGRTRKLGIVVVLVAVLAGAGWFFVLKPGGETGPKPGEVVTLDSIQVNLAAGHYLRLGMALQMTEKATQTDGSKALDAAIGVFSGLPVSQVDQAASREKLRKTLEKLLLERYHGEVMGVYFTEFVTQ
ncbi:hypothetical protein GCM10022237_10230 [Nocardioides ginsengisoli]|uniref:Flagellar protein FliL n=1 Tax=Nocardioides ginsengisoli TaxID=363868 RepID=A0ABW3W774_9ACTN